jgi:hypothetical protein
VLLIQTPVAWSGVCSLARYCSASAANTPVRLGEHSVRLVDLDVLPELAHLEIVVSIAEATQAAARGHTDPRLVARLVLGRRLVVAGGWRAVDELYEVPLPVPKLEWPTGIARWLPFSFMALPMCLLLTLVDAHMLLSGRKMATSVSTKEPNWAPRIA